MRDISEAAKICMSRLLVEIAHMAKASLVIEETCPCLAVQAQVNRQAVTQE